MHLVCIQPDSILRVFDFPTHIAHVNRIKSTDPFFGEDNTEEASNDPIIFIPPPS